MRRLRTMACLSLPDGARRLFSAEDLETLGTSLATPPDPAGTTSPELSRVIARLLEDGDSADLAWLSAAVGEPALADWLERHGERALSRRSLAFWEVALGRPRRDGARAADAPPAGASLAEGSLPEGLQHPHLPPPYAPPPAYAPLPADAPSPPAALPRRALWPL
jgi:hypothetical protein